VYTTPVCVKDGILVLRYILSEESLLLTDPWQGFERNRRLRQLSCKRRTTCKNALVVFEEIPPRQAPRSQRFYIFNFAVYFALFLIGSAIAWFCWSGNPLSVFRKIDSGIFVLCSLVSGVFLLTARSAHPRTNQERFWALFNTGMVVPIILGVLSDVLR